MLTVLHLVYCRKKGEQGEGSGQGDVPWLAPDPQTHGAPIYGLWATPWATSALCSLPCPASCHDTGPAQENIRHPNGTWANVAFTKGSCAQQRLFPQAGTGETEDRGHCGVILMDVKTTLLDTKSVSIKVMSNTCPHLQMFCQLKKTFSASLVCIWPLCL